MTDLWIRIEKINEDGNDKLVKEERALKTGLKNNLRENVVCAVKLDTKAQIVGHWIATQKGLQDTTTKMTTTEIISSMAIVTIVTRRAIKKLTAGQYSGTMQTT